MITRIIKNPGSLNIKELAKSDENKREQEKTDQDLIKANLDETMPVIRAGATPVTEKDRGGTPRLPTIDAEGKPVLYNPTQADVAVKQSTIQELDAYGQEVIPVPSPFTSTQATATAPATETGEEVDYLDLGATAPQSIRETAALANMDVEEGRENILIGELGEIGDRFDKIAPQSNTAKDSPQEFVKGM